MSTTHSDVVEALRRTGVPTAADAGTRAWYSSDASLYRIPPLAVAHPREQAEVEAVLAVCRATGTPLTARGAGTSVAGNAIGPGVVVDFSRHMNRVLDLDADARTATVQPGTVHATLQKAATAVGLRFGPDPSTHTRCTIGGMIGNNSCGSRSLAYGRTSDNVVDLDALLADGTRFRTSTGSDALSARLRAVMADHLAVARTEFGRFDRQVSGYPVQHLLPERFDLTRALVGTEGTLAVVTKATLGLVQDRAHRVLVVLGFDDIVAAGTAGPEVVTHGPSSCEGLDSRIVDVVRERHGPQRVPDLPRGGAWLFVEFAGDDHAEVLDRAAALSAAGLGVDARVVDDTAVAARLWRIREDGAGLAGVAPSGRPGWPGWEDAAVPPSSLGDYLAGFDELVAAHGLTCAPYGHFGEGCVHVRLDFPFDRPGGTDRFRAFLTDAAALVASHGGTLSGEHGDGRARSALLPAMYSAAALNLFAQVKGTFDPDGLLNPGVLVDPDPVDAAVRVAGSFPVYRPGGFALPHDHGDLAAAVHRCTGVGKCRVDEPAAAGVMCPSYVATRDERDSTRGRARVLQELVRGERTDWRAPEVHDALDLCLSCKGCTSECPTGIDMPTYKAEVLHHAYRRRLRPLTHYTLGRLPQWARLAGRVAGPVNTLAGTRLAARLAGVDPRRSVPPFAPTPFRRKPFSPAAGTPAVLFVDSFTDAFAPDVADAAVSVLRRAGVSARPTGAGVCCGLTWITTGQLDAARRILGRTVGVLRRAVDDGLPIIGLEPSCTAVLRRDAVDLLDTDDARAVATHTFTLAEFLTDRPQWSPPDLSGTEVVAQPHCHHRAIMTWSADQALLERAGATVHTVAGCCGLAGDFGMTRGHYDVSVAIAAHDLLPAVDAHPDAVVLADGFSCRTQLDDLRSRPSLHLAELLDREW
ncbi:MAG: FAD-binding oxidoreductase [Pseudonocardia sp.]|uniref:FAD-binding and (Fe-S)-binding domain-containing protein n=1 Tax=unclassified Pseudonocardia TaxID=2619320 RepID=UPI00086EF483|nr:MULTISPECIES: FAD-binding and (Fe-S)-binding domain-containing protein [unclassified Pseudonocardia]MBN9109339.1 FAD-binding oxidoreductase [Pseudonocardia sp.]ODU13583.1 MAG: oxidoreductase [Pseudonocardia sp. SCN 72-51]ODV08051.1 MAG: oxidoreductase [Pseudonocardia sp. SCN 73-27]